MSSTTAEAPASSRAETSSADAAATEEELRIAQTELAESRAEMAQLHAQLRRLLRSLQDPNAAAAAAASQPTQTATPTSESVDNSPEATDHPDGGEVTTTETDIEAGPRSSPHQARTPHDVDLSAPEGDAASPAETVPGPPANSADAAGSDSTQAPAPTNAAISTVHPAADDRSLDGSVDSPITPPPASADSSELPDWLYAAEDTSEPDEEELKAIEASGEVSARDVKHHEELFYADAPDDPEQQPLHKMRLTWVIKGVRGTKENPNRARIMNSPTVYVGGYYWYLKFFPRGNNSSALSAYIKCSRKERKPDKEVPENTFSAVYGDADADLGELEPAIDMSIPASAPAADRNASAGAGAESSTDGISRKGDDSQALPNDETAHASDPPTGKEAVPGDREATDEEGKDEAEEEDSEEEEEDWRVSAQIGIIIYNPDEPRTNYDMAAHHQFNKHNDDWGWTNFHGPWSEIHQRKSGQRQALLRNDTLAIDAYVRIFNDPSQALWWHRCGTEEHWDSISLTGYPAIGGRGNLSPAVAGIASWILLAPFRQIFDTLPPRISWRSSLFTELMVVLFSLRRPRKHDKQVSLTGLTKLIDRLGEAGTDVVTFWEGFRRSLELELEALELPEAIGQISDIFDGSPGGEGPPVRAPPLKIPVPGVGSVQDGLATSLAAAGCRQRFPQFLAVELERQTFDTTVREWKLRYDRVRLNEEIDLSAWSVDPDRSRYTLYGFVVHVDERTSGEFYPVLRPNGPGTKWLAFADGSPGQVTSHTRHQILEFEGLEGAALAEHKGCRPTAYLAMYVRTDKLAEFLPGRLAPLDLPRWLQDFPVVRASLRVARLVGFDEGRAPTEDSDEVRLQIYDSDRIRDRRGLLDFDDLVGRRNVGCGECDGAETTATDEVKSLTVPIGTPWQDLRKKLARWKGIEDAEQLKMWYLNPASPGKFHQGFARFSSLGEAIRDGWTGDGTVHLWLHVLRTPEEQMLFSDPEPEIGDHGFGPRIVDDDDDEDDPEHDAVFHEPGDDDGPREEPSAGTDAEREPAAAPPSSSPDRGGTTAEGGDDTPAEPETAAAPSATTSTAQDGDGVESVPAGRSPDAEPDTTTTPSGEHAADHVTADGAETTLEPTETADAHSNRDVEHAAASADEVVGSVDAGDNGEGRGASEPSSEERPADRSAAAPAGSDGEREEAEEEEEEDEDDVAEEDEEDEEVDDNLTDTTIGDELTYRPVGFLYGFIQLFDEQQQDFRVVGDVMAQHRDNVKETLRKRLDYADDKQFLVWLRGRAFHMTAVRGSASFEDLRPEVSPSDGFVLVVGEVLSDSTKARLAAASQFGTPEQLSRYLWYSARRHPIFTHTGEVTMSSFGEDYYSGGLHKGLFSGRGHHITRTGHSYRGPFQAGSRQTTASAPEGSCHYANGDVYTGGWAGDEKHGQGVFVEQRTGNKYVGGYEKGKRWGKGVTYWEVADEEGEMCQICYSECVDALFYDCGHVCACVECARQVDVCPICRKSVQQVVKMWKA